MAEITKRNLAEAWKDLTNEVTRSCVTTPQDLIRVGGILLEVLGYLCEEKVRLTAFLRKQPQGQHNDYDKQFSHMKQKGMHYEERKLMYELSEGKDIWDARQRLRVLEEISDACRRYESTLRMINDTMKLDVKLSFEGHN